MNAIFFFLQAPTLSLPAWRSYDVLYLRVLYLRVCIPMRVKKSCVGQPAGEVEPRLQTL